MPLKVAAISLALRITLEKTLQMKEQMHKCYIKKSLMIKEEAKCIVHA